uniref:Reverse transcriptase domain-containing protein n=1 Tax=Cacopsylla melanoneura TaxID=428564 RepID=A0A8D8WSG0_9HEMI
MDGGESLSQNNDIRCSRCPPEKAKLYKGKKGLRIHYGHAHRDFLSDLNCDRTSASETFVAHLFDSVPSTSSVFVQTDLDLLSKNLTNLKKNVKIIKRIPKGVRMLVASQLSSVIQSCLSENTIASWAELFLFSFKFLNVTQEKKGSLVQAIKANLISNAVPEIRKQKFKEKTLVERVEGKMIDLDIRGAVKLISSTDSVARVDEQIFSDLKTKHPVPSRPLDFPDAPDDSIRPLVVNSSSVLKSIDSFPTGSSGGIDGLSPQHLKDLVSLSANEHGRKLLSSLTSLCNFLLAGKVNEAVCPLLYGASLFALTKKDGGVRPIAVGSVIRRLVAKLSCFSVKEEMAAHFLPHQLGFGTKLGCEAAIHAARAHVADLANKDQVLLKIDFQNAFNSVERDS